MKTNINQLDQTSDWREEFEEIMKDNNLVCGLPIKNYGEEYLKDKKQLADSIQSLLDQQEQRHQREMRELIGDAGFAIETIRGYVDMENKEEAEKHLAALSRYLLDQISQSIK